MSTQIVPRSDRELASASSEVFTGLRIETSEAEWADTGFVWTEDVLKTAVARLDAIAHPLRIAGA